MNNEFYIHFWIEFEVLKATNLTSYVFEETVSSYDVSDSSVTSITLDQEILSGLKIPGMYKTNWNKKY